VSGYVIDDFSQGHFSVDLIFGSDFTVTNAANVPGGQRATFFDVLSNPEDEVVSLDVVPGLRVTSTGTRARTETTVAYGFDDQGNPKDLNLNLGSLGTTAFELGFLSNALPLSLSIMVYSNSGVRQSGFNLNVAGGRKDIAFKELAPYTSFVGDADFSDIDQIVIQFINEPDGSYGLGHFAAVPEPASLLAMGAGLAFLSRRRRSKGTR
jgi:hypothetical protein